MPRETLRRGARRSPATARRSSTKARSTSSGRASASVAFCSLRAFNHHVASQVFGSAVGTKITNTGIQIDGGQDPGVDILARPPRPFASEGSRRRLPHAQVQSATTEITVSEPGKAVILVRDPRPSRPPARKRRNSKRRSSVDSPSPSSATAWTRRRTPLRPVPSRGAFCRPGNTPLFRAVPPQPTLS